MDDRIFSRLLGNIMPGAVHVITGQNGSGKSRFFEFSTREILKSLNTTSAKFSQLLCMAGTMHDKYPRDIYMEKVREDVIYLGNKVNNNMVSDISPFRTLAPHVLDAENGAYEHHQLLEAFLSALSFGKMVRLRFRYGKGRKADVIGSVGTELTIDLTEPLELEGDAKAFKERAAKGDILLSDFMFERQGHFYGLSDLSSGEKQYLLSLFGVLFCARPGTIIFFDEPENSLHPSWQLKIARDITRAAAELQATATVVIATHSPLVASSLSNDGIYLCDFPSGQAWRSVTLHGRSADIVLRDQFHLFSARSPEVSAILNACLSLISEGRENGEEFRSRQVALREMNLNLTEDDPLSDVVLTILGI
ncbi:MAG: AAA family ATPase [Paracoccus sp. (in: a-proteobacteria)]|nr:AAA family ATPase [Paracoccus sp. (in: a-proteobacteria)]